MIQFASKTVAELREIAAQQKISGRSEMNKEELLEALESADLQRQVDDLSSRMDRLEEKLDAHTIYTTPIR